MFDRGSGLRWVVLILHSESLPSQGSGEEKVLVFRLHYQGHEQVI